MKILYDTAVIDVKFCCSFRVGGCWVNKEGSGIFIFVLFSDEERYKFQYDDVMMRP